MQRPLLACPEPFSPPTSANVGAVCELPGSFQARGSVRVKPQHSGIGKQPAHGSQGSRAPPLEPAAASEMGARYGYDIRDGGRDPPGWFRVDVYADCVNAAIGTRFRDSNSDWDLTSLADYVGGN